MENRVEKIDLPKVSDPRGNLTFIEELKHIPFQISRVYWIYDVPGGELRGSHAFKTQHEIILALSGSFDVVVNSGVEESTYSLTRSYTALYLPPMNWRRLENFSTNAVALVLSSHHFDEDDYIRDFDQYQSLKSNYTPPVSSRGEAVVRDLGRAPSVYDAAIVELQRIGTRAGHISVCEGAEDLPFDVRRVFCLYDIPSGEDRGAHAHKECHQFLIAVAGCFDVMLDDGRNKRTVRLDRPFYGLHIPPGIWAAEQSFSGGSVCLVLASHGFDESDYIRDYNDYLQYRVELK